MRRLGPDILNDYEGTARRPAYDRRAVAPGIVHLGIGAFHRAHQAAYIDERLGEEPDWAIIGASLRRGDMREALAPQDFLYTLAVRHGAETQARIIGAIVDVLHAPPGNRPVIEAIASPVTRIVTLTVTEKAYCRNPASGDLDFEHPEIKADLGETDGAVSVPGLLAAALAERRRRGLPAITLLSCDNLPDNGATLARVVTQFAQERDPSLARWIADHVAFPSSMVDRIVPATTDADREALAAMTGYHDAWPVVTEPFSQWVVEDSFAAGRPALELAGVIMTGDVAPFEAMKLRLLNASHSALAYLGVEAGYETVAEAVADPVLTAYLEAMMRDEIIPTLSVPHVDLDAYGRALLERFANTALKHRTMQIAMDGSQKIPQRLLGTIRDRIAQRQPCQRLALAVAAWIRHLSGSNGNGDRYEIDDPMARELSGIAGRTLPDVLAFGNAILDLQSVFGDLSGNEDFRDVVLAQLRILFDDGAITAMAATR
ncbi:mannitol dehydrogenase family protein [Hoeflea poritis]|uniref:Mannitol dehydrogenase family protein n=1 Tax=Hoeflea poritis TaxID=2993659 RepID=A0ABT4VS06_9HYPH|nr:mannitol dehydrogenase family protein [Hoeflea poritis]MDA4847491.1 mannitol dehydrogenase family protein [Hoeflea poritis]